MLEREEAKVLFALLEGGGPLELRDRAMFAVMLFGFVRVCALCKTSGDFEDESATAYLVLRDGPPSSRPFVPRYRHHPPPGERGRLEDAQALAGQADARSTCLYVRKERRLAQG